MADEKDVMGIVAIICAAYPNFTPTEHTVDVYYETLKDIPADLLKAATMQSISETGRKFAPSVGELRGAVAEIRNVVRGVPSSYQAWQETLSQICDVGSYGNPEFTSPLIAETVRLIGWRNLCMSENQVADRARFIQAYEQLSDRAARDEIMLPQVREYIERNGKALPAPTESIQALADLWHRPLANDDRDQIMAGFAAEAFDTGERLR